MRQTIKMRQIFNKYTLGVFLVLSFGILLIYGKEVVADYAVVMEMNGGGGGGGSGTATTTTSGTTIYTSAISLNVQFDKSTPYKPAESMILTSTASVNVCSNTALNLRVTGNITGPQSMSVPTILDQSAVGGQVLASTVNLTAPTTPGAYTLNVLATRYDKAGYVLNNISGPMKDLADHRIQGGTSVFYVSTNYRGRITQVKNESGSIISEYSIVYGSLTDGYGTEALSTSTIGEDIIKTYTSSVYFTVVVPSVKVYANETRSTTQININSDLRISWDSTDASWCTCKYTNADVTNADCTPTVGPTAGTGIWAKEYPYKNMTKDTVFSVHCE